MLSNGKHTGHHDSDIHVAVKWIEEALLRIPRLLSGSPPWDLHRDSSLYHTWEDSAATCLCGSVSRENIAGSTWTELPVPCSTSTAIPPTLFTTNTSIVDGYKAKASALRHAFDACQAVLAISTIVHT